jgi:hypothetical protein
MISACTKLRRVNRLVIKKNLSEISGETTLRTLAQDAAWC